VSYKIYGRHSHIEDGAFFMLKLDMINQVEVVVIEIIIILIIISR